MEYPVISYALPASACGQRDGDPDSSPDQTEYLALFREPVELFLGKDGAAVHGDLIDAARTGNQFNLDIVSQGLSQFFLQPGGSRLVVSAGAVFDGDLHWLILREMDS